ncbi:MAG: hypothetical protein ACYTFI_05080 [Planctomycetota bacterium]
MPIFSAAPFVVTAESPDDSSLSIYAVHVLDPPEIGKVTVFEGRVVPGISMWCDIDATASRFHGASIAGLVVGAMGVFVFTVALRHWLRERRAFREEARA